MKLPYKNNKEVVFKKMKPKQSFKLRNQESELTDFSDSDVEYFLEDMYISPYQFVVLSTVC